MSVTQSPSLTGVNVVASMSVDNVTIEVVDITPEQAKAWLGLNKLNRKIKKRVLAQYERAIENAQWVFNGATISFGLDDEGDWLLIDGQHRLRAISRRSRTVRSVVIWGLATDQARTTTDVGAKRTLSDELMIRGEKRYAELAALLNMISRYATGTTMLAAGSYMSNQEALLLLERHPRTRLTVSDTKRGHMRVIREDLHYYGSATNLCHYLFGLIDEDDRDLFIAQLAHGEGLVSGDPVYALRKWAMRIHPQRKPERAFYVAVTIKAWNAFRAGKKITKVGWRPGGANQEEFPRIEGMHPEAVLALAERSWRGQ